MLPDINDARIPDRIRERIQCHGCWNWTGSDSGSGRGGGYGRVSYRGATVGVHLLMWRLLGGRRLRPGEQLDHECNNRRCCNPLHLRPRTQAVNLRLAHKRRVAANDNGGRAACA
ncbi:MULTISPECIES: HNH endonuclease [unclassified Chelatococcus]|nr:MULTISPECIES: HNH endonuclease [unclassified Chelatococcus]MBS7737749.1 HNH endonuclease [Chelatococcus sp. HY11]MBX3547238.1 HNH endonuclease [Chelatococcus sp.]CAH1665649.1 hypothetical protein CHELA41_22699 [Hyphomicrobiales bacterium]CAH1681201.1 hypothetical protein CHELA20_52221 [Hyphomicrobiales bacterium]